MTCCCIAPQAVLVPVKETFIALETRANSASLRHAGPPLISSIISQSTTCGIFMVGKKNHVLGKWVVFGGFYVVVLFVCLFVYETLDSSCR